MSSVCITHFTDSLDHCDLIAFLVEGRLAFFGTPNNLSTRPMGWHLFARQFMVLTRRYTEVLLGDFRNVSLLLLQAPLIALMIVLV